MEKKFDEKSLTDDQLLTDEDAGKIKDILASFKSTNAFSCVDECMEIVSTYKDFKSIFSNGIDCSKQKLDLIFKYLNLSTDEEKKQLKQEFDQLKEYAYQSIQDLLYVQKAKDPVFRDLRKQAIGCGEVLERFVDSVADLAMLDLQENLSDKKKLEKQMVLQEKLDEVRKGCFADCATSGFWKESSYEEYKGLMKSSAIDSLVKQVVVSGVMLACLNGFDYLKWRFLLDVYLTSPDYPVRQRALVAIMLIAPYVHPFYGEKVKKELIDLFWERRSFKRDLLMVSKLLVRTKSSEDDSHQVHDILMKGLVNTTTSMMKRRLAELEDLEPDDEDVYAGDEDGSADMDEDNEEGEERSLFHLSQEESEEYHEFKKMADEMFGLMEGGADIYLQQFKRTMNNDFFNSMPNWFMPIHFDHPVFLKIRSKLKNGDAYMNALFAGSNMCDADAFSFLLSFPQDKRKLNEMMGQFVPQVLLYEECTNLTRDYVNVPERAAFRTTVCCLQDLYRFFMLAPMRHSFVNPFEDIVENPVIALTSEVFSPEDFEKVRLSLARYCLEREEFDAILSLLLTMKRDSEEYHYMLAKGYSLSAKPDFDKAIKHATKLLELRPDNQRFLFLMIDVCHAARRWGVELQYFDRVLAQGCSEETKRQLMLHKIICLEFTGDLEGAVNCAYEQYLAYPNDDGVVSLLGELLFKRAPADPKTWDKVEDLMAKALNRKKEEADYPELSEFCNMSPTEGLNKLMEMMSRIGKVDHTSEPHFHSLMAMCHWLKNEKIAAISDFIEMLQVAQKLKGQPNSGMARLDLRDYVDADIMHANGMDDEDVYFFSEMIKEYYNAYMQEKNRELKKILGDKKKKGENP